MLRTFFIILMFMPVYYCTAQADTTAIVVNGTVVDTTKSGNLIFVIAVNKRTSHGIFGDTKGRFQLKALPDDTLLVSVRGFETESIALKRYAKRDTIDVKLYLRPIQRELAAVDIFPERDIEVIDEERKTLGADLKELEPMHGSEAFNHPITALYQRFSKIEKSKRKVAEMEMEDQKNALLKELFRKYIRYDIIDLTEAEFDDFLSYLKLPIEFIMYAPQYDLIMAIKLRYEQYRSVYKKP